MNRLDIDFSVPGWRRLFHRTGLAAWLVALFALAAGISALSQWFALRSERVAHAAALDAAHGAAGKGHASTAAEPEPALTEPQALAINAAIMQLNLPWRALREAVDGGTPDTVALLALEPDARRHSLRITAETTDSDIMVGYVERLKRQPLFSDVTITRHEVVETDANRPIRFTLEARWEGR